MLLINGKTDMGGKELRREKNKKTSRGKANDYLYSCLQFSQSSALARRKIKRSSKGFGKGASDHLKTAIGKAGKGNNRPPHYSGRADCGKHTRGKTGPGLGSRAKSHPQKATRTLEQGS